MRNVRKLKGTNISISNDYSSSTRHKRRLLWQSGKEDRANGKKVTLIHDKLKVDGVLYMWDEDGNDRAVLAPKAITRDSAEARSKSVKLSQNTKSNAL